MSIETFIYRSKIPAPAEFVFDWHMRPRALERLTPPWENVEVGRMSDGMSPGSRGEIVVRAGPLKTKWIAEIRDVQAGRQFQDVQMTGPFASWVHTHTMIPDGDGGSILEDHVEYELPGGALGKWAGGKFARRKLERMFAYRHRVTHDDVLVLYRQHLTTEPEAMKILVSGLGGLIGSALAPLLSTAGHEVVGLSRSPGENEIGWNPRGGEIDRAGLAGVDAVVHLAGENISKRWSQEQKRRIRESRVQGTKLLCETLAGMDSPPKVLVCASAIGYYGDRGDEILTESSPAGGMFLSDVCREWEAACEPAREKGIRVVNTRFGVVLSPKGGALAKMLTPFKMGAGGKVGSGKQYMSWIALDDVAGAIQHGLMTGELNGPVNVMSPNPCTNSEFTKTLGKVLSRPTIFPMPAVAARLAFGEMADELLLASARALPERLQQTGYEFRFPHLEPALRHLLGK